MRFPPPSVVIDIGIGIAIGIGEPRASDSLHIVALDFNPGAFNLLLSYQEWPLKLQLQLQLQLQLH